MRAADWMTSDVQTCRPESTLDEAAHRMWTWNCGALPVVGRDGRVVGMITDRDLCMGAYLKGRSLRELTVREAMTPTVFTCLASDPIEEVVRRMGDHQVRRVPVLDTLGKLVGIVSLDDLARHLARLQSVEPRPRLLPRLLEALASISEPRGGRAMELVPAAQAGEPVLAG